MSWVRIPVGIRYFSLPETSRRILRPSHRAIHLVPVFFVGIDRPDREANYSPPSSVEDKKDWNHNSPPPVILHAVSREKRVAFHFFTLLCVLLKWRLIVRQL